MDFATALAQMGVREDTLTQAQKRALDEDGYLIFEGILSPAQVQAIRRRADELIVAEGKQAGSETYREEGAHRISNLINKDPVFDCCFKTPQLLAAAAHVLGELKISSVDCRFALPGHGMQKIHQDWLDLRKPPPCEGNYYAFSALWLLDDFTAENGATRYVPGSHRLGQRADQIMEDRLAPHPDQQLLIAPAGTAIFYNAHLFHGGTQNTTNQPRRAAASSFVRRDQRQLTNQRELLRPETAERLSEAEKFLLDVT